MRRDRVRKLNAMLGHEILLAGWMDAQHERHRGLVVTLKGDVVPCPDFQNSLQIIKEFVDPTIVFGAASFRFFQGPALMPAEYGVRIRMGT